MTDIAIANNARETGRGSKGASLQWEPVFAPALFQTLFWMPRFSKHSPAMLHVPLVFWLSAVLQPRHVTVLGCDDGIVHFAFCQALDKLGLDARCNGYGFWSEQKVPAPLAAHEAMLYEEQSNFNAGVSFSAALEGIDLSPVDILFVDLSALPKEAFVSGEALMSCLNAEGVLVLHGTNDLNEREIYGRNLSQFLRGVSHVEFSTGNGLMLVLNGESQLPAPLKALLDLGPHGTLHGGVEFAFRRSGQGASALAEAADLAGKFARAAEEVASVTAELKSKHETLDQLKAALEERGRKFSGLQSELFDQRNQADELRQQMTALKAEADAEIIALGKEYDAALAESEAEKAKRFEEAASFRCLVEQLGAELAALKSERDSLCGDLEQLQVKLEADRAVADRERAAHFEETSVLTRIADELRRSKAEEETALNAHICELQGQLAPLKDQVKRLLAELSSSQSDGKALRGHLKALQSEIEATARYKAVADRERAARFEETAALTLIAEDLRRSKAEEERVRNAHIRELEKQVVALYSSTSWKVSAPMRWMKQFKR